MELWWRCAALEALQAYVMSQLALCSRPEGIKIQKTVTSLLQPTLDAIMAAPILQVGMLCKWDSRSVLMLRVMWNPRLSHVTEHNQACPVGAQASHDGKRLHWSF